MALPDPDSLVKIITLVVLVWISSFFSSSESAFLSVNKIRMRAMADEGDKRAQKVLKLQERTDSLLSSILVGNNLVNIGASSLATALAITIDPVKGVGIATVVMTVVLLIFGEITPKTMATRNAEKYALRLAGPITVVTTVLSPAAKLFNLITNGIIRLLGGKDVGDTPTVTEAELKTLVDVGHEEGVVATDEKRMINNVFDFGDAKAKDVMTPRTDIAAISVDAAYEEIVDLFREERFSRLPVYEEDIDDIIGVLYLKDLAFVPKEDFMLRNYLREVFFTYENKSTTSLFNQMRTAVHPMAIVLDEYGGTSGLITMEDLVEEIVGDIFDEFDMDETDDILRVRDKEYLVEGTVRLEDFNQMLDTFLENEEVDTIGGYVIDLLGYFPKEGESVVSEGVTLRVEKMDNNRIEQLRVFLSAEAEE